MAWGLVVLSVCTFLLGTVTVLCGIVPEPAAVLAAVSVLCAWTGVRHLERGEPQQPPPGS
jgi:hypothetical protein